METTTDTNTIHPQLAGHRSKNSTSLQSWSISSVCWKQSVDSHWWFEDSVFDTEV